MNFLRDADALAADEGHRIRVGFVPVVHAPGAPMEMRANGNQPDDCGDGVFSLDVTLRSHRRWLWLSLTKVTLPLTIRPTCVVGGDQAVTPRPPS